MKIERFEDLIIWKESRKLVNKIYSITNNNNFSKDYGLKDQIRRASVSILSNISEGFERQTDKEFKQFLFVSKGSCGEVRAQLYIALDQGYLSKKEFDEIVDKTMKISCLISNFIKYLSK